MGWLAYSIVLISLAFITHLVIDKLQTRLPHHFDGQIEKGYEDIQKAFQQNFIDGWESEGASLAVFVKGKKVVDVWGGYADKQAARKWEQDTISVTFSSTKAVAAVCIAILADRGRLKYDDLVSKHWPDFAKNDKGNITIEWVLAHISGLQYFDTEITKEMAFDHNLMRSAIQSEVPKTPPGSTFAYHAFTYGWLVDQIIRHTDEKHRGIGQFFREEIAEPNGIDYHIGLSSTEEYRVARVVLQSTADFLSELWHDPKAVIPIIKFYTTGKNHYMAKAFSNPSWVDIMDKCTVNDPEQHAMEQAAALGIGNARSLASIFNLLVTGRLIGEQTLTRIEKPVLKEVELFGSSPLAMGLGFFHHPNEGAETSYLIGHSGFGCQQVIFDTKNQIVFAYVTNGMKAGVYDGCRNYARIHKAVLDTVKRRKED